MTTLPHPTRPPLPGLALALCLSLLAGCGGGGGGGENGTTTSGTTSGSTSGSTAGNSTSTGTGTGSGTTTTPGSSVPEQATAQFASPGSLAAAQALAAEAEQRGRDLRLARGLTSGLTGTTAAELPLALAQAALQRPPVHSQASHDYSGTLCSSGSATLEIAQALLDRFNANPTGASFAQGDTLALVSRRCVVRAGLALGDVALGSYGVGATVDGRVDLTLSSRSGSDLVWTLRYTGFDYTPWGGSSSGALDATLVYGTQGGQALYALDLPDVRFLAAPVVTEQGTQVTIASGRLRGPMPAAAGLGYTDISASGWVYDSASLRASAGQMRFAGADGASATVTAGSGGYTVHWTVGGVSQGPVSVPR